MSLCRSCGAEVLWRRTVAGRSMPLDFEPCEPDTPGAMIGWDDGGQQLVAGVEVAAEQIALRDHHSAKWAKHRIADGEFPAHLSHFATCPNGPQHRRPR